VKKKEAADDEFVHEGERKRLDVFETEATKEGGREGGVVGPLVQSNRQQEEGERYQNRDELNGAFRKQDPDAEPYAN